MKNIYLFVVFSIGFIHTVTASTILQVDTSHLVNNAESVFEGEVVSARSELSKNGKIYTYVDFLVLDVVVGDLEVGTSITLRFTGGTVGGSHLDVGSTIPVTGEHGIYFVEAMNKGLSNPLLGWSQGHFRVRNDGKVMAGNNQLVVGVEGESSENKPVLNSVKFNRTANISRGVAKGITTELVSGSGNVNVENSHATKPLSIEEFKASLKALKKK